MKFKSFFLAYVLFYTGLLVGITHIDATLAGAEVFRQESNPEDSDVDIDFMLGKPSFTEFQYYNETYGSTNLIPSLGVSYKFLQFSFFSLGAGLKLSYYSTTGHPLKQASDGSFYSGDYSTSLKIVPYQFYGLLQLRPFQNRFVVFDFWAGYEELYFEEVRYIADSTSTTTTSSTSTAEKTPNEINSGWNKAVTFGLSINFLINQFEEQAAQALSDTTGLNYIYVAPFVEVSQAIFGGRTYLTQQPTTGVDFSRISYGILFKFET